MKKEEKIKYFSLKPILKKKYGRNYKILDAIERNTQLLKEILEQLKIINSR